ncbi:MAG: 16S rRNA (cytosine(967)-C(5))-methyltransferase RsmB, partial [Oscillospiraceae bacterium]|nr:16S rRNA (cytosine(967)-C(5))-methyltransferase RsmB [Oscillospiraceae bacterium]
MPNARKKAVDCLIRCERGGYSNLVLLQELASGGFDARDRAFCTALVYGTLSRRITIDRLLERYVSVPLSRLDGEVLQILRSGVYQLFWMDSVPARAAVNESVALCRQFRKSSACGLVNAVLRKCSDADISEALSGISGRPELLSVRYSMDPELAGMLDGQYEDRTEEMLEAMFTGSGLY